MMAATTFNALPVYPLLFDFCPAVQRSIRQSYSSIPLPQDPKIIAKGDISTHLISFPPFNFTTRSDGKILIEHIKSIFQFLPMEYRNIMEYPCIQNNASSMTSICDVPHLTFQGPPRRKTFETRPTGGKRDPGGRSLGVAGCNFCMLVVGMLDVCCFLFSEKSWRMIQF